jgi:hypothetical protein
MQPVRNVIHAFKTPGLARGSKHSTRPKSGEPTLHATQCERRPHLLHQAPRPYGQSPGVWTLALAAEVCDEPGVTERRMRDETIRRALTRLGTPWQRAKPWITRPDPQYTRQKSGVIG